MGDSRHTEVERSDSGTWVEIQPFVNPVYAGGLIHTQPIEGIGNLNLICTTKYEKPQNVAQIDKSVPLHAIAELIPDDNIGLGSAKSNFEIRAVVSGRESVGVPTLKVGRDNEGREVQKVVYDTWQQGHKGPEPLPIDRQKTADLKFKLRVKLRKQFEGMVA